MAMQIRAIWRSRLRIAAGTVALGLLLTLSYHSFKLAFADWLFRQNTIQSVQRATHWAPDNADYYSWLASLQEFAGQDPALSLHHATEINRFDSNSLIRLAANAEARGDAVSAEKYLLQAGKVDQQFAPRWGLMNFYFRQDRPEPFWFWVTKALDRSYGDLTPVFDLCWRMTENAAVIRKAIPAEPGLLAPYLAYLMDTNRPQAAEGIAKELSERTSEAERTELLTFCDRSNQTGSGEIALAVWNTLCDRKLLPYGHLSPEDGISLTNAGFAMPFYPGGFDWQASRTAEIEIHRIAAGLTFQLSGTQPDNIELLSEYLPILAHRSYTLHFQYQTQAAGIGWEVTSGRQSNASFQELTGDADGWHTGQYMFGSADASLCRLVLKAVRIAGHTRPEGEFSLRNVRLELNP
jgi:hypothetical protein